MGDKFHAAMVRNTKDRVLLREDIAKTLKYSKIPCTTAIEEDDDIQGTVVSYYTKSQPLSGSSALD